MAGFINGLDQVNLVFWLATPVGQIQRLIFPSLKRSLALLPCSFNVLCVFIGLDFVSVKKKIKKERGQYPAALTSPLVNNAHCTIISKRCGQSWHQSRDQQITKAWFYSNPLCSVLLILILISFLHCIFFVSFFILYMTVLRIKREKEKLIIRFKYLQAAKRNTFTFTRIMVFILFFHV